MQINKLEKAAHRSLENELNDKITKLIKILNAYGLDENTPIDRRELHGDKGNYVCLFILFFCM